MAEFIGWSAGFFAAAILFKSFFKTKDDFFDCMRFWFTPDIISAFRGEFFDDHWAEFKLFIWVGLSICVGYGAYKLLS